MRIQTDIFDHLLAATPDSYLRLFQESMSLQKRDFLRSLTPFAYLFYIGARRQI